MSARRASQAFRHNELRLEGFGQGSGLFQRRPVAPYPGDECPLFTMSQIHGLC
jgi:hypothetical protein